MKHYVTATMVTLIATKSFAGVMPEEEQMTANLLNQTAQLEPETYGDSFNQLIEFVFMALFIIL